MSAITHSDSEALVMGGATDEAASTFLHDLVAVPSVSGEERVAVERFVAAASALGLDARIDEVGNGIATVNARSGGESRYTVVLLGHIDTVPGDIAVRIENGMLHGRGSVDAKGPLATMLFAAARATIPADVTVHVIAAVGEEALSPGARHVAATLKPDACIIGEPSGWDGVTLGYKGCLNVRASVRRHSTHSANPDPAAPDILFHWWRSVLEYAASLNDRRAPMFDQLQASITSWSSRNDGHDDRAALKANFRLPPTLTLEILERELLALADPFVQLDVSAGESPCSTSRDDAVVRALSAAIREEGGAPRHKRKTGTADFNIVGPIWRCPIAAYGPGDSSLDHTPHEHVHIEEFLRSIRVLERALEILAAVLHEEAPLARV